MFRFQNISLKMYLAKEQWSFFKKLQILKFYRVTIFLTFTRDPVVFFLSEWIQDPK